MVPAALAQLLSFLVLEGAEPLLGLCVQLFQMRRSPTGEENVVLKFISYRSWPLAGPCALTVVTLGLSRALLKDLKKRWEMSPQEHYHVCSRWSPP